MTDQEMNVAIAEACGWTVDANGWWSHPTLPDNGGAMAFPPSYCNDLNAMHEAENHAAYHATEWFSEEGHTASFADAYIYNLRDVLAANAFDDFMFCGATARQRAEAFLRTLGKWKEGAE